MSQKSSAAQLKAALKEWGLSTSSSKPELWQRLLDEVRLCCLPSCHWQRLAAACPSFTLLRTVAHTVQSHAHIPLTLHVCVPPCRCRTAKRMQAATR